MGRLIIEGNAVYEIDEECLRKRGQGAKGDAFQKKGGREKSEGRFRDMRGTGNGEHGPE